MPTLGAKLRLLSHRVHEKEGFFVLRGLQPWRYRRIENTIAFTGIASYIGNRRGVQCANGPVMSEYTESPEGSVCDFAESLQRTSSITLPKWKKRRRPMMATLATPIAPLFL